MLLDKDFWSADPELMGCFGVGILAKQKVQEGFLTKSDYDIDQIIATTVIYEKEFQCKSCDNFCPIRILNVNGHKYMFGGRCNKYANIRKKKVFNEDDVVDYIEKRNDIMFNQCAPERQRGEEKNCVVASLVVFDLHSLAVNSWVFHALGVETLVPMNISHKERRRVESYCFPAEIAHAPFQDIFDHKVDYIFFASFPRTWKATKKTKRPTSADHAELALLH